MLFPDLGHASFRKKENAMDDERVGESEDARTPDEEPNERSDGPDAVIDQADREPDPAAGMRWVHNGQPIISVPDSQLV